MTDDVRAAAGRVRRCLHPEQAEPLTVVYGCHGESLAQYRLIADQQTLAIAYLTDRPADDNEPVTAEWLKSLGGQSVRGHRPKDGKHEQQVGGYDSYKYEWADAVKFGSLTDCTVSEVLKGGGDVSREIWRWTDRDEWWLVTKDRLADPTESPLPPQPTRGHVRRLLRALGKETT